MPQRERPGVFIAAVLLHVIEGFFSVIVGTFGVAATVLAGSIVAVAAHGDDDAVVAVLVLAAVGALLLLSLGFGLVTLFLAYKAWGMERVWVIALIVFSLVTLAIEPCGILTAVLTLVGGLQVLELDRPRAG
jgi:hypothetical protein